MIRRRPVTVRESVAMNAKAKESFLRSDKNMEQYVRVRGQNRFKSSQNRYKTVYNWLTSQELEGGKTDNEVNRATEVTP